MNDDELLLKLRRHFSRDEVVQMVEKRLKEAEFEIGVLKSELAELRYENEQLKQKANGMLDVPRQMS